MQLARAALILVGAFSVAWADQKAAQPTGHLRVEHATYDAGKVERGATLRHSFVLRNVGKSALSIDAKPG